MWDFTKWLVYWLVFAWDVMDTLKLLIELISYEWINNESYMHESILTKANWNLWTNDYDN